MEPKEQVNRDKLQKVFEICTGRKCESVDAFIHQWSKNKEKLFHFFGDKLKIEAPISGSVDEGTGRNLIKDFVNENADLVCNKLERVIRNTVYDNFVNNKCGWQTYNLPAPAPANYKVGMKLSAVLRHYVENPDEEYVMDGKAKTRVEWFDIQYSKLRQSLNSKGVLAISIDPLDILTMSVNSSGWRSCHNAINGEYRGGCMSYASDESSVIAYVYNGKEVEIEGLKGIELPSKNWRQMIYMSLDSRRPGCVFSRQYPRYDYVVEEQVHKFLSKYFKDTMGIKGDPVIWDSTDDEEVSESIRDSIDDCEDHLHYSDICSGYDGYMLTFEGNPDMLNVPVGNHPVCPSCGTRRVEEEDTLLCEKCRHMHSCSHCGEDLDDREGEGIYHEGIWYCRSCFAKLFVRCDDCGSYHKVDELKDVGNGKKVCDNCFEYYIKCGRCGQYHKKNTIKRTPDGSLVCSKCYEDLGYHSCASCRSTTTNTTNYRGYILCDDCLSDFLKRDADRARREARANQKEETEEETA